MQMEEFNKEELIKHFPESPLVPFMEPKKFAELTGYSEGVVQGWCNRGYLATYKVGKHNPINLIDLHHRCTQSLRTE